ncbi:MoaD/ThiS family protein [Candidatus Nitrosocosmicus arcticus]|uniref:Small subunit of molybdopterin synthase n=1 Tax=Candidatus Nitrosocosmicus arcticus TaxID=2035267 RepID=A0A557SYA9_9ARCH|nr:MoaD/ThiS family protein [Candidatus Nitrosocosmicus arcticus]TVP41594.1 small subunit of molybdopterin synthase [Candidatus Nitrosocosmicus arcticus]
MTSQLMPKIRVTVLYFAQIHETTRTKQEIMELSTNTSIKDLVSIILTRYPNIKNIKNVKISVNYHIVNSNSNPILKNDDEVALLPPISGG